MQWHRPPETHFKVWEKIINRKDLIVTKNTKVCSNHFVHGKPLGDHLHRELWMRGYSDKETLNISVQFPNSEQPEAMRT